MAGPDENYGLFGAIGMHGTGHGLADQVGAPLPPDFHDPDALSWIAWVDGLTEGQRRHLRALLWRQGRIVFFDSFLICAALTFPWMCSLRAQLRLAEMCPEDSRWGGTLLARLWRTWLRVRGLGHRIATAHALRAVSEVAAAREDETEEPSA